MEPKVNYLTVGLFVLGLLAVFIAALVWFSSSHQKTYQTYEVYMDEPASGLSKEAPVKFNGVEVGFVKDIYLNPDDPQQVILLLNIEVGTPINQSTTATLSTQGITGVTNVGLKAGAPHAPPISILPGDKYPIIKYTPSILFKLDVVLSQLAGSMKGMTSSFQKLFSDENQKAIHDTLGHLSKVTDTLDQHSAELGKGINAASATFDQTKVLTQTMEQQALPGMIDSLTRLNNVLDSVEQVAKDLKQNPSMFIRGAAPPPRGPGE